jgi:hypothetical protein
MTTTTQLPRAPQLRLRELVRAGGGGRYAVAVAVDALGTGLLRVGEPVQLPALCRQVRRHCRVQGVRRPVALLLGEPGWQEAADSALNWAVDRAGPG